MAESNRDELADALARLAGGEIAPSEQLPPAPLKQVRAAAPSLRPPPMPGATEAPETMDSDATTPEDDDWVMAPVPQEDLAASPATLTVEMPKRRAARGALYQTLGFRQTIIPVLLTCGMLTLVFAALKFVLGPESIFADLPGWVTGSLIGAGVLLLTLAGVNMIAVKHQLRGGRP